VWKLLILSSTLKDIIRIYLESDRTCCCKGASRNVKVRLASLTVAWIHEGNSVGSTEDDVLERERRWLSGSEEAWGKGCALPVLFERILLWDSACSSFRHVHATTFVRWRRGRRLPTFLRSHVPSNLVISRMQVTLGSNGEICLVTDYSINRMEYEFIYFYEKRPHIKKEKVQRITKKCIYCDAII